MDRLFIWYRLQILVHWKNVVCHDLNEHNRHSKLVCILPFFEVFLGSSHECTEPRHSFLNAPTPGQRPAGAGPGEAGPVQGGVGFGTRRGLVRLPASVPGCSVVGSMMPCPAVLLSLPVPRRSPSDTTGNGVPEKPRSATCRAWRIAAMLKLIVRGYRFRLVVNAFTSIKLPQVPELLHPGKPGSINKGGGRLEREEVETGAIALPAA